MRQKTELLLSEAHKINVYACLDIIRFRHVSHIKEISVTSERSNYCIATVATLTTLVEHPRKESDLTMLDQWLVCCM